MPRVPTYDRQQVQTAPLPDVRMSGGASVGAGVERLGQGLQQAAGALGQIVQAERAKADQIAVLDVDRQLVEFEVRALHDAQSGALHKRGRDAFGLPEQVLGDFDKVAGKLEAGAGSERQKMAIRNMVASRRADIDKALQRHVAAEIRRYDDTVTESYMKNSRNAAVLNWQDPERVEMEVARQRAALADHAQRNGLPADWLKARIAEATSSTHMGVLNQMMAHGQDLAGKAYVDAHRDDLVGDDAIRATKMVEDGSLRGESQRQADRIISETLDLKAAMAQVRQISDPKVRDAARQRVNEFYADEQRAKQENIEGVFNEVSARLEQNGGDLDDPVVQAGWFRMSLGQRNALRALVADMRAEAPIQTDPVLYHDLVQMAENPGSREAFNRIDLTELRGRLAFAQFKELVGLQAASRRGDGAGTERLLDGIQTPAQIIERTMHASGIDLTRARAGSIVARRAHAIRTMVDMEVRKLQEKTGQRVTTSDVEQILGRVMGDVQVPGWPFGLRTSTIKRTDMTIDNVPASEQRAIIGELVRQGVGVTDDAIIEAYVAEQDRRGRMKEAGTITTRMPATGGAR
jgi:hypothetical protein